MVSATECDSENRLFALAEKFVLQTSRSLFLTGKAGTGKTTFLRKIKSTHQKNTVIVAPTGVAAVNAGGTTIHSFFQLPFSPFSPRGKNALGSDVTSGAYALLQNLRIESEKRKMFRELQLLIIDEISMVRCDVLDAIDVILRHFRRKPNLPFGGVQVLFIGDLFQLPPVAQNHEWSILQEFYQSPFFFDSYVIRESPPLYIELKKVYRQRDDRFIDLLNHVRNNEVTHSDLRALNERYDPTFQPTENDHFITLTTHNLSADKINNEALQKLSGEILHCHCTVEGDFPERSFPTDKVLCLKEGAQVMFIKNDMEKIRRYYNGKIGVVSRIEHGRIFVIFPQEAGELEVEKETWRNVRYSLSRDTGQIEEEVIGTFAQYPLRLAWAITIHKSQGLTFERAIIDAANSFAPGQVYVALSRCVSIEGIVLKSKLHRSSILTDQRILEFSRLDVTEEMLGSTLEFERKLYLLQAMIKVFDWSIPGDEISEFRHVIDKSKNVDKDRSYALVSRVEAVLQKQQDITAKFEIQLRNLLLKNDLEGIRNRIGQGVNYFTGVCDSEILALLNDHRAEMKGKKKIRKYMKHLNNLIVVVETFRDLILQTSTQAKNFHIVAEESTPTVN